MCNYTHKYKNNCENIKPSFFIKDAFRDVKFVQSMGKTKGSGEIAHRLCDTNLTKSILFFLLSATKIPSNNTVGFSK